MELFISIWNWYVIIIGYTVGTIILVGLLGVLIYYIWWRYTCVHCPDCSCSKFYVMIGGPPKCIKCGWQNVPDHPFADAPPLAKRFRRYRYEYD